MERGRDGRHSTGLDRTAQTVTRGERSPQAGQAEAGPGNARPVTSWASGSQVRLAGLGSRPSCAPRSRPGPGPGLIWRSDVWSARFQGPARAPKPAGPVDAAVPGPSAGASVGGLAGPGRVRPTAPGTCCSTPPEPLSGRRCHPAATCPCLAQWTPARACPGLFRPGPPSHPHWAFSPCSLTGNVWPCTSLHTAVVPGGV